MVTSFKTIKSLTEGLYREKGSKFIALAIPVTTIAEVESHLLAVRKKYHDARHHCYAYVLEPGADIFRASDDGEPNHSAGDPIFGQIRSFNLTNVLVVVVRYFGGTKLGISGLVNAYKTSTKDALEQAIIITKQVTNKVKLLFPFPSTNEVMKIINEFEIKITIQTFDNDCSIEGIIPVLHVAVLRKKVQLLNNIGIKIDLILH